MEKAQLWKNIFKNYWLNVIVNVRTLSVLQYLKYVYLFLENSGCLFSECIFFNVSKLYQAFFFLNKLHLSVIKRIGSASLCGIQIIHGLNSQPFGIYFIYGSAFSSSKNIHSLCLHEFKYFLDVTCKCLILKCM